MEMEQMRKAAYVLRAVAHETRLCIIDLLSRQEEMSVGEMVERLACEQSLLSHHLTDMRAKGVLNVRKEGKSCFYSLRNKDIVQVIRCIEHCQCQQS